MNHIITFFIVLALISSAPGCTVVKPDPSPAPEAPKGELIIGARESPIQVYRNVPTQWMVNVLDVRNPCLKKGQVKVAPRSCYLENTQEGRFKFEVPGKSASITVYLELEDKVVKVGLLRFDSREADMNDPDFQIAYPDQSWNNHLARQEMPEFGAKPIVKDSNYVLDMPMPVLKAVQAGRANRIHARFAGACLPLRTLVVEAKGARVEALDSWNDFSIVPEKGYPQVELRFWTEVDGLKKEVATIVLPVE